MAANYNAGPQSQRGSAPTKLSMPESCAGLRLDQALAKLLPEHSRTRIRSWIEAGRVTVDGTFAEPKHKMHGGECVLVAPLADPRADAFTPEALPLAIVHEDDSVIVIDKPPGLVVHPGSGNWRGTLANALLHHVPELQHVARAGIVHRLDKDTSGLLVVAKTETAQTDLIRQLQSRTVRREYLALVHGDVAKAGSIDAPIGRHPVRRTSMAIVAAGKPAVTHYEVRERFGVCTLLSCRLETGRTHQIRVHMAALGHPLIGDPVYGRRGGIAFSRQALHAWRLGLVHPATRQPVQWESPLPADFANLLATLRHGRGSR